MTATPSQVSELTGLFGEGLRALCRHERVGEQRRTRRIGHRSVGMARPGGGHRFFAELYTIQYKY